MNYKDAYYFLFNQLTDLQRALKVLQLQSEDFCISPDEDEDPEED